MVEMWRTSFVFKKSEASIVRGLDSGTYVIGFIFSSL